MAEDINSFRNLQQKYVNKNLFLAGLSALQIVFAFGAVILAFVVGVAFLESFLIGAILMAMTAIGIGIYFRKISTKNEEGDPNFYQSRIAFTSMKKTFVDSEKIMKHIVK